MGGQIFVRDLKLQVLVLREMYQIIGSLQMTFESVDILGLTDNFLNLRVSKEGKNETDVKSIGFVFGHIEYLVSSLKD